MQLDSVRELKQSLKDAVLTPLTETVQMRAFGVSARPLAEPAQHQTLALGVTRRTKREYALAVRVQHRGLENSEQVEKIRKRARGEVDVRYIGRVVKQAVPWYQQRNRPLRIGGSIGHFKITAGTLGCFVRSRGDDSPLILSNNHVLANENRAKKGDTILQPGRFDDGQNPKDAAGTLLSFVRLKRIGANLVDCAIAVLTSGVQHDQRKLTGLGKLAGVGDIVVDEGTEVGKVGRTTGGPHLRQPAGRGVRRPEDRSAILALR